MAPDEYFPVSSMVSPPRPTPMDIVTGSEFPCSISLAFSNTENLDFSNTFNASSFIYNIYLSLDNFVDRKSTRLNSSHANISYAVFCLKKKIRSEDHTSELQSHQYYVCRLLLDN